jgi:hypothetical protein
MAMGDDSDDNDDGDGATVDECHEGQAIYQGDGS